MYILLDANVTAAYYLPRSTTSKKMAARSKILFDSVRSRATDHFFYLPNFCVAEVFSVFMKYAFASWNSHVKKAGPTIDKRVFASLRKQFQADIHNGKFIYHYELSRYHILGMNLVAPVDHYFKVSRVRSKKQRPVSPMGTFDHLIISMGIHLAHIHGNESVIVVSGDRRLTNVLAKCKSNIPAATVRKLKLDIAEELTGRRFQPSIFPKHVNLVSATDSELRQAFGVWPLPVGHIPPAYRWAK